MYVCRPGESVWHWQCAKRRGVVLHEIAGSGREVPEISTILGGCPFHGRVERDEIPTRESPPKQSGTR